MSIKVKMAEMQYLYSVFKKYSKEKRGYLVLNEFILLLEDLGNYFYELKGVTSKTAHIVYILIDYRNDEKLDFQEFSRWWKDRNRFSYFTQEKTRLIEKAYNLYSKYSQNKKLTLKEFSRMMYDLGISYHDSDFDQLDVNEDGYIDFREFCKWLEWF